MNKILYAPRELGGRIEEPSYYSLIGYIVDTVTIKSKTIKYKDNEPQKDDLTYDVEFPSREKSNWIYEGANKLDTHNYTANMIFESVEECKKCVDRLNKNTWESIDESEHITTNYIEKCKNAIQQEQEYAIDCWKNELNV